MRVSPIQRLIFKPVFLLFISVIIFSHLFSNDGKCIQGDCKNGKGILIDKWGRYSGEFINQQRQGHFEASYNDGEFFL